MLVFGVGDGIPSRDYGRAGGRGARRRPRGDARRRGARARCGSRRATPRWGRELDDRVLPAEAGLDERAISFTKGCYPGQEPIARLHYRGHANRELRVLEVDGDPPGAETRSCYGDKVVGRVTSAVPGLALAYVRVEVPDDAELEVGGRAARLGAGYTDPPRARSSGDRALPCGGRGRRFESCRAHRKAPASRVAGVVEGRWHADVVHARTRTRRPRGETPHSRAPWPGSPPASLPPLAGAPWAGRRSRSAGVRWPE